MAERLGSWGGASSRQHHDKQDVSPLGARFRDRKNFAPLPDWKVGGVTMTGSTLGAGTADLSQIVKNKDIFEKA